MYNDQIIIRSESEIKSAIKNIMAFNLLFSLAKKARQQVWFPAKKSVSLHGSQYYARLTLLFYGVIH